MMLADKIMKERKKKGWSQEELAEHLDVSRQSVSKWEGGLSVPDLDKIIAMSELFGVSTDYLLKKDNGEETDEAFADGEKEDATGDPIQLSREVSDREAEEYLACIEKRSWRIAFGVMLCILSPITLILLCGLSGLGMLGESAAIAIGLLALFAFIGSAVALFILNGMPLMKYEYLEKECISISTAMCDKVTALYTAYQLAHRVMVTIGCLLCITGVVPLVILAVLFESELWVLICVGILMALVSVGVLLFVRTCYINGSYQKLLQIGEFAEKEKTSENDFLNTVYWCVVTALYLAVSFLTGKWNITWVIWVIAGVLSPILDLIVKKTRQ